VDRCCRLKEMRREVSHNSPHCRFLYIARLSKHQIARRDGARTSKAIHFPRILRLHSGRSVVDGEMDSHPLKVLLQLHLASDSHAVLHLPSILSVVNAEVLQPSPHTQKWTTRIHSLLHSKDASARWAGLCIAMHTSVHSRALMLESAQGWITVALPLLSVCNLLPSIINSLTKSP
jgi:hypothetical protein